MCVPGPWVFADFTDPIQWTSTESTTGSPGYFAGLNRLNPLSKPASKCDDRVTRRKLLGGFRLLLRKQTWDDMGCTCTLSCRKRAKKVNPPTLRNSDLRVHPHIFIIIFYVPIDTVHMFHSYRSGKKTGHQLPAGWGHTQSRGPWCCDTTVRPWLCHSDWGHKHNLQHPHKKESV